MLRYVLKKAIITYLQIQYPHLLGSTEVHHRHLLSEPSIELSQMQSSTVNHSAMTVNMWMTVEHKDTCLQSVTWTYV
jgi:hypothetical protein